MLRLTLEKDRYQQLPVFLEMILVVLRRCRAARAVPHRMLARDQEQQGAWSNVGSRHTRLVGDGWVTTLRLNVN